MADQAFPDQGQAFGPIISPTTGKPMPLSSDSAQWDTDVPVERQKWMDRLPPAQDDADPRMSTDVPLSSGGAPAEWNFPTAKPRKVRDT